MYIYRDREGRACGGCRATFVNKKRQSVIEQDVPSCKYANPRQTKQIKVRAKGGRRRGVQRGEICDTVSSALITTPVKPTLSATLKMISPSPHFEPL